MSSSAVGYGHYSNLMNIYQNQLNFAEDAQAKKAILEKSSELTKGFLIGHGHDPAYLRIAIAGIFDTVIKPFCENQEPTCTGTGPYEAESVDLKLLGGCAYYHPSTCDTCNKSLPSLTTFDMFNTAGRIILDTAQMHNLIDHDWCVLSKDKIANPLRIAEIITAAVLNRLPK